MDPLSLRNLITRTLLLYSYHSDIWSEGRIAPTGYSVQAPGSKLQARGSRLQATGYRLQVTGYRLQAAGSGLQAPGSRLQATGDLCMQVVPEPGRSCPFQGSGSPIHVARITMQTPSHMAQPWRGRKAPSNAGDAPRAQINGHQWPSMAERKPAGMSRGSFKACTRGTCSTLPTFWHLWHKANRCEACAVASLLRPENGREPGIKITTHMMRHGDGDNIVHDEGK